MSVFGGQKGTDSGSIETEEQCEGTVVSVSGETVSISLETNPACAACSSKSSCALVPDGNQVLEVNAAGFAVGDRVRIIKESAVMLKVSLSLYLVPTILILIGSFAGYKYGPLIPGVEPDMGGLIGVVGSILLSLAYVHFFRTLTGTAEKLLKLEKVEDHNG